jgi:hypothetical protein
LTDDLEPHRAQLLALGLFTQADLTEFRARALDAASGEPPRPGAMLVATGFVRTFSHDYDKHTYYKLIIDGQLLDLGSDALFERVVDGGAYRVYFTPDGERVQALEPVALAEVPDAVAEAVLAAGLDPSDPAARRDARVASIVREGLLAALGRALDFTGDDLAANRTGRMTAGEQQKLRGSATATFGCATFVALIGLVVAGSMLRDSVVAFAVIGAVTLLIAGVLVRMGVRSRRDAAAQRVVSGVGRLAPESKRGESRDLVIEDGTSFSTTLRAIHVRGHQPTRLASLSYRVYYAPNEIEIMSLEPVDIAPVLEP